jgi:RNA polymerase sigma-70 factor (ECF subfamily)
MTLEKTAAVGSDDASLARRIGERDERAFEMLMRSHNRLLYRVARSILKDEAEAEDAVQETYLAAYRNIGSFRGGAKLSTWLTRIVINEAYARLRKQKHAGVVVSFESARPAGGHGEQQPSEGFMPDDKVGPEDAASRAELRQLLERRIDALPEQFRTVFILRDIEEMSVEETAGCLELPEATVRTRAFRARALLRESLSRDIDIATADAFAFAGERCDGIVSAVLNRLRSTELGGTPDDPA